MADRNRASYASEYLRSKQIYCDRRSECASNIFSLTGHVQTEKEKEADLLWIRRGYMRRLKKLGPKQLLNHLPNETAMINKGLLTENLGRLQADDSLNDLLSPAEFYQPSYCLYDPISRREFFAQLPATESPENLWIYKPCGESRGRGIKILWQFEKMKGYYDRLMDLPIEVSSRKGIIQRYIKNPLLLEGRKSEMRVYWLVASIDPLIVLIYPEPTVRLNNQPFSLNQFDNQLIHVTNVYQQKRHPGFDPSLELKWSFNRLGDYLHNSLKIADADFLTRTLMPRIREILASVVYACVSDLRVDHPPTGGCFGLYGADIILDSELNPWLTEVQKGPGLSFSDPIKKVLIPPMLSEATQIALEVNERKLKHQSLTRLDAMQRFQWITNEAVNGRRSSKSVSV